MISITIIESSKKIIAGIPEYVTLEVSELATVFYTLDGSEPTEESEIYIDKIYLTYTTPEVNLKLLAVGVNNSSSIISETWNVTIPDIDKTSLIGREGVSLFPKNKPIIDNLAVDTDGNLVKTTAVDFHKLDMRTSTSDRIGQPIPENSTLDFIKFPKYAEHTANEVSSTNSINFDPKARLILIDGYSGLDKQMIRIINRPNGSITTNSPYYSDKSHYDGQPTGDFIRYMYNNKTKKIVFYYRDYIDNRWIISTQKSDMISLNLTPTGNKFVFPWIKDRAYSTLF